MWRLFVLNLIIVFTQSVCRTPVATYAVKPVVEYNNYRITGNTNKNASLEQMLKPYSDSVNASMKEVIGLIATTLEKDLPEGTLNNIMADAMLHQSRKKWQLPIHIAVMNSGGVRLNQIPAGPLTKGKVFELMPFDNLLIVQEMTGAQLQELLNHIASRGGWPIAGATFGIKNKKAVEVRINGESIDQVRNYWVANTDYIINGGDGVQFLKPLPQLNKGYLIRDALMEYFLSFKERGQSIRVQLEKRITDVE
jgi:2',3'-cyclic-nucleotide 2'-phosphodiesterase (5'-nucleotidase family)